MQVSTCTVLLLSELGTLSSTLIDHHSAQLANRSSFGISIRYCTMAGPDLNSVRLGTLNEDILHVIMTELAGYRLPLSSVSRFFRALCLPVIFHRVVWGAMTHDTTYPPMSIWKYIRVLTFSMYSEARFFPLLPIWLPQMPDLHTIRVLHLIGGVSLRFFKAIFSAPGLRTLQIVNSPYTTVEPYDPAVAPIMLPMRQFIYRRPLSSISTHTVAISPDTFHEYMELEALSLQRIVAQIHSTLETLTIPGETAGLDLMTNLSWPCLRELVLFGISPLTDVPMSSVLSHMQSLRTLHLEFIPLVNESVFLVCPPGSNHNVPPDLTSFTLSWPSLADQIFCHLPSTLRYLSLRDYPRIHIIGNRGGDWLPVLTSREILEILRSSDLTNLESLELLYKGGAGEAEMLTFISTSLPSLSRLELRRLRPNRWSRNDDEIPIEVIGITLSKCKALRNLRVNLDFFDKEPYFPYQEKDLPFDESARMLAEMIPTLSKVSIYWSDNIEMGYWSTYLVDHGESGLISIAHQPDHFTAHDLPISSSYNTY